MERRSTAMSYVHSRVFRRVAEPPRRSAQEGNQDIHTRYLALILEAFPDVQREYALDRIKLLYPNHMHRVVAIVAQEFTQNPSYPKVEEIQNVGGETPEDGDMQERPLLRPKIDYGSKDRPRPTGKYYKTLAFTQLLADFPSIPTSHVKRVFASNNSLYTPTYNQLTAERKLATPPFKIKTAEAGATIRPHISFWKGKNKDRHDGDFEEERAWLLLTNIVQGRIVTPALNPDVPQNEDPPGGEGDPEECECCFSPSPFCDMVQCPDTHLFCKECMIAYVSSLLGQQKFNIVCMSQSGCKLQFPDSELKRFLTPKLLSLYERLRQRKEIEMAKLEGLEECPNCDYGAVIDDPEAKIFVCYNEECGIKTCRRCQKRDHRPKECADVEKKLSDGHIVEEAMTSALVRKCPKCDKEFVKESGCNKITCGNCGAISCYICRKAISNYKHFDDDKGVRNVTGCVLFDKDLEGMHNAEVEEARKKAVAEIALREEAQKAAVASLLPDKESMEGGNRRKSWPTFFTRRSLDKRDGGARN